MSEPTASASFSHLLPPTFKNKVTEWLAEDTPSFDYGGAVVGETPKKARLLAKSAGVLAGVPFFNEVFTQCGCTVEWHRTEGEDISLDGKSPIECALVQGPVRGILLGERVALNILARCSGVATRTRSVEENLRKAGYKGIVAGTRKTTPGFRLVEKYGMLVGGADTHRMDLSSMIMLKDNHIWSQESITKAVKAAKALGGFSLKVEVEVQSKEEANEAIKAGADVVMLDNFSGKDTQIAAQELKQQWRGEHHFLLEVSGGLTADNVADYAHNDIDIISTSYIHQGVPHVDFSLKISRE